MFTLALSVAAVRVPDPGAIRIADYSSSRVSDRWRYKTQIGYGIPIIPVGAPDQTTFGNVPVHRRAENSTTEVPAPLTLVPGMVEEGDCLITLIETRRVGEPDCVQKAVTK